MRGGRRGGFTGDAGSHSEDASGGRADAERRRRRLTLAPRPSAWMEDGGVSPPYYNFAESVLFAGLEAQDVKGTDCALPSITEEELREDF